MTRCRTIYLSLTTGLTALLLCGCVSMGALEEGDPDDYKHRLLTKIDGGVRVSVSALSPGEAEAAFGVPLAKKGIQPVWVEVENKDDTAYWLMHIGIDPNFFTPTEAADAFNRNRDGSIDWEREQKFREMSFVNPVVPGATMTGFIFTNLDEGVKIILAFSLGGLNHDGSRDHQRKVDGRWMIAVINQPFGHIQRGDFERLLPGI